MKKNRFRIAVGLKICAIALCLVFALRGHPPAAAQHASSDAGFGPSVEDARQDDAIANLRESTDKTEAGLEQRMDMAEHDLRDLRDDFHDSRTESRCELGCIGLLSGGGIIAGWRRKREEAQ